MVALQRERQLRPVPAGTLVQVFDRSPLCTLALAQYLKRPVTPLLTQEVTRLVQEQVYQKRVFFVRPLAFIERTAARRISPHAALAFETVHEQVYLDHGLTLVDVPAGTVPNRADALDAHLLTAPL